MPFVPYICPDCGKEFEVYADYVLRGVEGAVQKSDGSIVIFADPTATHSCDECLQKAFQKFIEEHEKENLNAENSNPEN